MVFVLQIQYYCGLTACGWHGVPCSHSSNNVPDSTSSIHFLGYVHVYIVHVLCVVCVFTTYTEHVVPTHALVKFCDEEGEPLCVVPTKRIRNPPVHTLQENCPCEIVWSDGTIYKAKMVKMGKVSTSKSNHTVNTSRLIIHCR